MQKTVQTHSATTPAETPPWFPTVEANQGFISVGALVLALIAFIFETIRANGSERARRKEFRKALIAVVDQMKSSLDEGDWAYATRTAPKILNALLSAPPPAPALIAAAVDFLIQVESEQNSAFLAAMSQGFPETKTEDLNAWRAKFRDA